MMVKTYEFNGESRTLTQWAAHVLLRIGPKNHVEPNIAFGYRALTYRGDLRQGLELGVPHRYVLYRDNLRQVALELRPSLIFGFGTVDAALEAALLLPIVEPVHVRLGGRIVSFGDAILGGANLGLSFHL